MLLFLHTLNFFQKFVQKREISEVRGEIGETMCATSVN